jgi:hypothetical protein
MPLITASAMPFLTHVGVTRLLRKFKTGTQRIKYEKYVKVKNLLHKTNGAEAGWPPKNIKIIKFETKSQNQT